MAKTFSEFDDAARRLRWYRLDPQAPLPDEARVRALARARGFELPDDYVDFCCRFGAGAFDETAMLDLPAGCALGRAMWLDVLWTVEAGPSQWDALRQFTDTYANRLPRQLLPVGTDPGGNLLLLGAAERAGVYAWDHEHRELRPGELQQRIAALAGRGIATGALDVDQLLRTWEEQFPQQVGNATGHGNLYRVADSFAAAISALHRA